MVSAVREEEGDVGEDVRYADAAREEEVGSVGGEGEGGGVGGGVGALEEGREGCW